MMKTTLARRAALVDNFIKDYPAGRPDIPERLAQAMLYSLEAGGKRLRPVLCLSAASLYSLPEKKALPFAAAIEFIHTYSLIHDDLPAMDNDDLRRGKPSNHKQFDEATAILAGDGLLTDAFYILAETPVSAAHLLPAIAELAKNAGSAGMVGGQMLDMQYTAKSGISLEQIAHMQAMKTGAMITAACVCGALLAGAAQPEIDAMRSYGHSLGKAFQIADDILDVTATTAELGKPAGSDQAAGKITYPSLIGLDESRKLAREEAARAASIVSSSHPDAIFLRQLAQYAVERSA